MFIKLLCAILVLNYVTSTRISDLKCDQTASLVTDSQSLYPYLMEIVVIRANQCAYTCRSTEGSLSVRKFKLQEELYSNSEHFNIKEFFFPGVYSYYNFALIQLNKAVPLHTNASSIYRPACFWKETNEPSSNFLLLGRSDIYDNWSSQLKIKSFSKAPSSECTDILYRSQQPPIDIDSYLCFNTGREFRVYDNSFVVSKIWKHFYVFGIIFTGLTDTTTKINFNWVPQISNDAIAWIESIVWPGYKEPECGVRKIKHRPLMMLAEPPFHGEFPWHVAVFRQDIGYACGGTIINTRSILTAAHCTTYEGGILPVNQIKILAGTHKLNVFPSEAQNYTVVTIIIHQNFSISFLEYDIAILKTGEIIEFSDYIQPICLSNSLDYDNITMGLVAGWGRNEQNELSTSLLKANLPILDNYVCRSSNRDFFPQYLNDHNYCAGYDNGTNACTRDSSGSMIIKHNSRWYIRGIAVGIHQSERCDITLVLFTNVPKLYNWIVNNSQ